ncbi:MAG: hypothetical protein NT082_01025 [Chloroflexi bacterium]|nr:hypothetical protein [Chloroflexota bacterium]
MAHKKALNIALLIVFTCIFLLFNFLVACSNPAVEHVKLGDIALEKGHYDLAISEYSKAAELDPSINADSKINLVNEKRMAQLLDAGDYDKSIEAGLKALETSPSDSLREKLADAYISRAWYYKSKRLNPYTLTDLNSAVNAAPEYFKAYYERGRFYNNQWQYNLAIPELNKAITLKADFAPAYSERAFSYYKNQKWGQALLDVNKALDLDASEAHFYYTRSLIYKATQKYALAINDLETTMKLTKDTDLSEAAGKELQAIRAMQP